MKRYIVLDKKQGETPLETLTAWKEVHTEYRDVPASYAGRLDPMASGKLLVLLGEECKKQTRYTNLDKEYELEVLLDVGSDTGDALGLTTYSGKETRVDDAVLMNALRNEQGTHMRSYPIYSSKTVNGKPLFLYALEGTLSSIQIPEHLEQIYRIQYEGSRTLSSAALKEYIQNFLTLVPKSDEPSKKLGADFRIDAVRAGWNELFKKPERSFILLKLRVTCGTGTYMRSLAPRIGEALGTNALALSIHRTKVGKYWNGFWLKGY